MPDKEEFVRMFESLVAEEHERLVNLTRGTHGQDCTCSLCREFWLTFGPDPETGDFGPFGHDLLAEYAERLGEDVATVTARLQNRAEHVEQYDRPPFLLPAWGWGWEELPEEELGDGFLTMEDYVHDNGTET